MRIVSLMIILSVLLAVPAAAVITRSIDTARSWDVTMPSPTASALTGSAVAQACGRVGDIPVGIPCCARLRLVRGKCMKPVTPALPSRATGIVVYDIPMHKGVVGACYNGARICKNNALLMCKDHEWKVAERCDAGQVCVSPRGCVTPATELRKTTRQPVTPLEGCERWKPYASQPKGCPQDLSNSLRWSQ